jgi:hypothetical protein
MSPIQLRSTTSTCGRKRRCDGDGAVLNLTATEKDGVVPKGAVIDVPPRRGSCSSSRGRAEGIAAVAKHNTFERLRWGMRDAAGHAECGVTYLDHIIRVRSHGVVFSGHGGNQTPRHRVAAVHASQRTGARVKHCDYNGPNTTLPGK